MPKARHRVIRPSRLEAVEFGIFLYVYDHSAEFRLSLLVPLGSDEADKEIARLNLKRNEVLNLLRKRLRRGLGKAGLQLGQPDKRLKIEMPVELLEYIARFEPKRVGFFGGSVIDRLAGATLPARSFVATCAAATRVRRGRPTITPDQIERRELGALSERQMYRMIKRNDRFREFVARNPTGLFDLRETD